MTCRSDGEAGRGDAQGVGQARRGLAHDHGAGGLQPLGGGVAPGGLAAAARPGSRRAALAAAPKPAMPGTFSVPPRRPRSWPPPCWRRDRRGARAEGQRARRPAARRSCGRRRRGCRRPARGCRRRSCRPPGWRRRAASRRRRGPARRPRRPAGSRRSRCWPASGRRTACRRRRPSAARRSRSQSRSATPFGVDRQDLDGHARTPWRSPGRCRARWRETIRRRAPGRDGALDGQGVGLGAAAGEDHGRRPARRSARRPASRACSTQRAGRAAGGVDRRRIAADAPARAAIAAARLGPDRRGGVVVEVDGALMRPSGRRRGGRRPRRPG